MSVDPASRLFASTIHPHERFSAWSLPRPQPRALRTILDVSEYFGETSGGVRTYLSEKARFVERSGSIRQLILVPGPRDVVTESERVRCYRLGCPRIPGYAPYRFLLAARAANRILTSERPDIVEVGSPGLAPWHVVRTSKRLGIPLVFFYHSHIPKLLAGSSTHPTLVRRAGASIAWSYLRHLDGIFARTIVPSRYAAAELARAGIERTVRVPLGVDLDEFHPDRRSARERIRTRLEIGDRPIVVFAGRLAPEKRVDVLLRAWPGIARRTGAVLLLAGDGPLRLALQGRHTNADVRWLGFLDRRSRVADLLASADVVVSPGAAETFGLATLEALASGTPVLSAHEGGGSELVNESGGGACFESGNDASLATELEALLAKDRSLVGDRGRLHAESNHGWHRVFSDLFGVYDDVLSESR